MAQSPDQRTSLTRSPDNAQVFLGTSGWAYAAWKPVFYPEKLPQKKFLQHYASRLNAVEVNYSFRHFLGENTLENWIADTPPCFAFCIKAHQAITHVRRLNNAEQPLRRFLDSVQPLASSGKLGAVLFQLPPNLKADPALLDGFLDQFPHSRGDGTGIPAPPRLALRVAFEFRHESWLQEPVFDVLRRHHAALCVAESEKLAAPDIRTADFSYYRFRRSDYPAERRREIAAVLHRQAAGGHTVFAFFKHEERPESALWSEEVLKLAIDPNC